MEKFKKNIKQKFIVCTIAYAVMFSAALILSMLTAFEILIPVTGDAAFCGGLIGGGAVMLSHALNYRKGLKNEEKFFNNFFVKLSGTKDLQQQIENGLSEDEIRESWKEGIEEYKKIRSKYLLYEDF